MKKLFSVLLFICSTSLSAQAELRNVDCQTGWTKQDFERNIETCEVFRQPGQICESDPLKHGQGLNTVCRREVSGNAEVGTCWRGWNSQDREANLRMCQNQLASGDSVVCETDPTIHGEGGFDVCEIR